MTLDRTGFYFEAVRHYRRQAVEAHKAGNNRLAARCLIEAGRNLLLLAQHCEEPIAKVQLEKTRNMRRLALEIVQKPGRKNTGGKVKAPEDAGAPEESPPLFLSEVPNVTFDDIIGLDDLKMRIRRFVAKFRHPVENAKWSGARLGDRMILYGPPGTGKTMFAKAIANEIDATFFLVKGSNIMDKWVGESQKNVRRFFQAVHKVDRAVVFMDEIDGILSKRGSSSSVRDSVVSEFLQEMDGLTSPNTAFLLIGATNLPNALDKAVVSRFGAMFPVQLPDKEARLELLKREFAKFPYGYSPEIDLDLLADRLENHSMRSIATLAAVLSDIGIENSVNGVGHVITLGDVKSALGELPLPSRSAGATP